MSALADSRPYRYLRIEQLVLMCGTQLRMVAVPHQVFRITCSSSAVRDWEGGVGAGSPGRVAAAIAFVPQLARYRVDVCGDSQDLADSNERLQSPRRACAPPIKREASEPE